MTYEGGKRGHLRLRALATASGWTAPVFRNVRETRKRHLCYKRQYFDEWEAQKLSGIVCLLRYFEVYRIWKIKEMFRRFGKENEFYELYKSYLKEEKAKGRRKR